MGTVHSGKISHLTWTFTKKYWAVLGCTGLYWAVLGHLRYLLGNVQVKWRILPLCNGTNFVRKMVLTPFLLMLVRGGGGGVGDMNGSTQNKILLWS